MYRFREWKFDILSNRMRMVRASEFNWPFIHFDEIVTHWQEERKPVLLRQSDEVDGNNVPIWEGDIITYVGDTDDHILKYYLVCFGPSLIDSRLSGPIHINGWYLQDLPEEYHYSSRVLLEPGAGPSFTVVGNKFENTELLKCQ